MLEVVGGTGFGMLQVGVKHVVLVVSGLLLLLGLGSTSAEVVTVVVGAVGLVAVVVVDAVIVAVVDVVENSSSYWVHYLHEELVHGLASDLESALETALASVLASGWATGLASEQVVVGWILKTHAHACHMTILLTGSLMNHCQLQTQFQLQHHAHRVKEHCPVLLV